MYQRASGEVVSLQLFLQRTRVALVVSLIVSQNTLQEPGETVHPGQHGHQVPGTLLGDRGQGEETTAARHLHCRHICRGGKGLKLLAADVI